MEGGTYRVVDDDVQPVLPTAGDELRLDISRDGVVHGLVDGRLHPAALACNVVDLRDLPGGIVGQAQLLEFAFFEQIIAGLQRVLERHATIRRMQVEDIDRIGAKLPERLVEGRLEHFGLVLSRLIGKDLGREL